MLKKDKPSFSISVGNTYSSSAFIKYNIIKHIVPNTGKYFHTAITFNKDNDNYLVFRDESKSVVYDMMKYIGKKYDEIDEKELIDKPYKIIKGVNGYCEYEVLYNNEIKHFTPTYILSLLFKRIKEVSTSNWDNYLKSEEDYPVILTIPADFTNLQRREIIKAANEAGLKVEKLISEPIAASFAYLHNKSIDKSDCNILVCDFGENSFESSIFNLNNKKMKVISSSIDDNLGGKDITNMLEDYVIEKIKENCGIDVNEKEKLKRKVHKKCNEIKIYLSDNECCDFDIKYEETITKPFFNSLCDDLFEKAINIINKSIDYGKVKNIDYIILIGGSSNIPRFQQIVKDHFPSIPILKDTNSQDNLAEGACWYMDSNNNNKNKYEIINVLLRSLSIGVKQNKNIKLTYGIDLGTTFSSSAYIAADKNVKIIQDRVGSNSIPSCVLYSPNSADVKVGSSATQNLNSQKARYLLYDSKRFIGKKYNEIPIKEIESYPFELVEKNDAPHYKFICNNEDKYLSPINISCEILKYIHDYSKPCISYKNISEDEIEIVIGVPAAFTKEQRECTKESGRIAGFKNVDLLSEPTAAALSYIFNNQIEKKECKILVYDFGGGTFDVSIIELKNKVVTVLGTFGDEHLGGEDITMRLEEYMKKDIKDKYGIDANKNERLKSRIHKVCEEGKISLSSFTEANFDIELGDDIEYQEKIARNKFEGLCLDLFNKTIDIVNYSLKRCNIKNNKLDYIILVGGTSRIPKLEELLKSNFEYSRICKSVSTDQDVAKGCAIHSQSLIDKSYSKYKIIDNSSIYSEDGKKNVIDGYNIETIIDRQCELPIKCNKTITIGKDERIIRIYEDKLNSTDQMLIGETEIGNHINEEMEIEFEADNDGLLKVRINVDGKEIEKNFEYF